MMRKLIILFNTLRYLKWQQIYFRLVRKLIKPRVTENFQGQYPKISKTWEHLPLYDNKINRKFEASFLNFTKQLNLPSDWNKESPNKLWVYNLHYFEDLLSNCAKEKRDMHLQMLNRWIDENPVGYGNGWEPYPTSLRIVNILKAWLGGLQLDKRMFRSVFEQASFLSNDLENHLLGNHYFVNLKALLFAGVIFEHEHWLQIAEKGLNAEIEEQILEDGANFELSPMYHSLMLVDMLDMYNLSRAYPTKLSNQLVAKLEKYIPKMLSFMESMGHPDGGLSFFNDSVDGIAPKKAIIESYAEKLEFVISTLDASESQIIDNTHSGYICATCFGNKLIFDASSVGPDYIPGHAHADTLSFELSIETQRVFVNSGISEYSLSQNRFNQRKTFSHNTIEVDGKDSSQVWSSFRVAKRAKILDRYSSMENESRLLLQASHNGFKSKSTGCIHKRCLTFEPRKLIINDVLDGSFRLAKSFFHFHPDLRVTMKNRKLRVEGKDFLLYSNLSSLNPRISETFWHPEFGISIPNKKLEITFNSREIEVIFDWG
ncbi:MAG: heparinase [Rickettsiales bacterium]|nr:heparinase [Rickettsiales bacterium]